MPSRRALHRGGDSPALATDRQQVSVRCLDHVDDPGVAGRAELATKADLESVRTEVRAQIVTSEERTRTEIARSGERTRADFAHHTRAITEELRTWFKVLDEKSDSKAEGNQQDTARPRGEFEQHRDDDEVHRRPRRRTR